MNKEQVRGIRMRREKIVVIGDQGVGKSSILYRFIFDWFDPDCASTIGIDFLTKNIKVEEQVVKLQFWDTAGQERFRSLIPIYMRDCNIALIVFDLTNETSFENVLYWHQQVQEVREGSDCQVMVVGNQSDRVEDR